MSLPWREIDFFQLILPIASSHIIHCISLFSMDRTVGTVLAAAKTCALAVWHSLGKSQSSEALSCILPAWHRWRATPPLLTAEVLSSFQSELPFVLKGVCFAVRFLRETSWWRSWPPQHLSHTSCGPQGMSKFILKSCDPPWVKYSPFLLTGADEAAEMELYHSSKSSFASHLDPFPFRVRLLPYFFPLDFSLAVICANSFFPSKNFPL